MNIIRLIKQAIFGAGGTEVLDRTNIEWLDNIEESPWIHGWKNAWVYG